MAASHLASSSLTTYAGGGLARLGPAGAEQFGDAEVEELRYALGRDENVRRLDVAVDDQVLVRILERVTHLSEQVQK